MTARLLGRGGFLVFCLSGFLLPAVLAQSSVPPEPFSNLVVLRLASIEQAMSDLDRLSAAAKVDWSEEEFLGSLRDAVGLAGLSFVDRKRPAAMAVTTMTLTGNTDEATLLILPVREPADVFAALGEAEEDERGLFHLTLESGQTMVIRFDDGYAVVGHHAGAVAACDVRDTLAAGDLSAETISFRVELEPVAPLAKLGLQVARQQAEQMTEAMESAEDEKDRPLEGGEGGGGEADAAEEGGGTEGIEPATDPRVERAMQDMAFGFLESLLDNVASVEGGYSVRPGGFRVRLRLTPREGTTFAEFAAAQSGGLPELARYIPLDGSEWIAGAGQIRWTPAFREAWLSFYRGYLDLLSVVFSTAETAAPELARIREWWERQAPLMEQWLPCMGGEWAVAYRTTKEGLSAIQLTEVTDPERCGPVYHEMMAKLGELPGPEEGKPLMEVIPDALVHRGVRALRHRVNLSSLLPGDQRAQFALQWFGASVEGYAGVAGDALIAVTGPRGAESFKEAADRVLDRKGAGGLKVETFAPLEVGPGFFVRLDLVPLLDMVQQIEAAEQGGDRAKVPEQEKTDAPQSVPPMAAGVRFEGSAAVFEMALPLELISYLAELAQEAAEQQEQSAPEKPEIEAPRLEEQAS